MADVSAPASNEEKQKEAGAPRKEKDGEGWKGWARDIAIAVIIVAVVLGGIYAYTGVWPPLVVVESSSMQHSDTTSYIGVIDTGDLVFVQAAPTRADVTTYLQGRASDYTTYGDYGDVIIFRLARDPSATPIIHRAIMYVIPNGTSAADVPDLGLLPTSEWQGYRGAAPHESPYGLTSVTIHGMGWQHNLGLTFNLQYFAQDFGHAGYITMGDNNAYNSCGPVLDACTGQTYDTQWFPSQGDIIGHARGEIPWFGLIKLLIAPTTSCAQYWGDPCAPANSWTDLAISLVVLVALPFILEAAGWAWSKYAWPRIKPHLRRTPPAEGSAEEEPKEPREGSSGP